MRESWGDRRKQFRERWLTMQGEDCGCFGSLQFRLKLEPLGECGAMQSRLNLTPAIRAGQEPSQYPQSPQLVVEVGRHLPATGRTASHANWRLRVRSIWQRAFACGRVVAAMAATRILHSSRLGDRVRTWKFRPPPYPALQAIPTVNCGCHTGVVALVWWSRANCGHFGSSLARALTHPPATMLRIVFKKVILL